MRGALQVAAVCALGLHAGAQGTFQNLDFEQANPGAYSGYVSAASALPDWTAAIGGVQQTQIGYNFLSTGETVVSLVGGAYPAIDGNYDVLLVGGVTASSASISQTGTIPDNSQSLLFKAQGSSSGQLNLFIGTQVVPFTAVGTGPNYTLYGANISAWAGDSEQLTFSAPEGNGLNAWFIDDISFATQAVPEPTGIVLTVVGGLLFGTRKWFARR
jgi:hypothetical protein